MPTPTATAFRPGRRSHRGRRERAATVATVVRIDFAGRCSTSWEAARRRPRPRFRLPGAAVRGVPEPPQRALQPWQLRLLRPLPRWAFRRRSRPLSATVVRRDRSRSPGSSSRSASGPSGIVHGEAAYHSRQGLTAVIGQLPSVALNMRKYSSRQATGVAVVPGPIRADGYLAQVMFSNQENFLFRFFSVWQSNGVRSIVAMVAALLGGECAGGAARLRRADCVRLPRLHPRHHGASGSGRAV